MCVLYGNISAVTPPPPSPGADLVSSDFRRPGDVGGTTFFICYLYQLQTGSPTASNPPRSAPRNHAVGFITDFQPRQTGPRAGAYCEGCDGSVSSRPRAGSASISTSCLQNDIQGAGKGASEPINQGTDRSRWEKEKHEGKIKNNNPDPGKTAWLTRARLLDNGCSAGNQPGRTRQL